MITQTYNLNLIPGGVPVVVPCSQRDAGSRTVVFNLYNGSERFTGTASGIIEGTRADGTAFSTAATVTSGTATWTISLDMTATAGRHTCELILTDANENVLGTANFVLDVEAEAKDPDVEPTEEEETIYEQMRTACASLVAQAAASATAAASSATASSASATEAAASATEAASFFMAQGTITLSATWSGSDPYTQTVTVSGASVTSNSLIELQLTDAQLDTLESANVNSLRVDNNNGTLTAHARGGKPSEAMTIQCTVLGVRDD